MADFRWNKAQREAIDRITSWIKTGYPQAISLSGPAGTGKSSLLREIKDKFGGSKVAWAAMTGKAALRVHQLVGVDASTLHGTIYGLPSKSKRGVLYFNNLKNPDCEFLVVDEASMMPPKIYEDLKIWMNKGVKILFVGDGYQLPPVMSYKEEKEWGSDFSIFKQVDGPELTEVMRSGDDIIDIATQLRHDHILPKKNNESYSIRRSISPEKDAIKDFLSDRDDHMLITWRNRLRMSTNWGIRKELGYKDPYPEPGEPVIICKNGKSVLNGEIHYSDNISRGPRVANQINCQWMATRLGEKLLVSTDGKSEFMDGFMPEVHDWKEFGRDINRQGIPDPIPITYGYVGTAHKCQGSDFRRVTVFLSEIDAINDHFKKDTELPNGKKMPFYARWLYTAITRAKSQVSVIVGRQ